MTENIKYITKKLLYDKCVEYVETRIQTLKNAILDAKESASGEEKSSVGDKYETSRAMAHLEQEKYKLQLNETLKLKRLVDQMEKIKISPEITLGSVIITDKSNFYISVGAGKLVVNKEIFYAISATSPVARKLTGKTKGETIELNNQKIIIKEVF